MIARRLLVILLFAFFAAPGFAQTVTTGAATNVADITATLNGVANASGGTFYPYFEYGLSTNYSSYGYCTPASISGTANTAISCSISGLQPNTTYHYCLFGYNANDVATYGTDMTFTTGPPSTPPTVGSVSSYSIGATTASVEGLSITGGGSPTTVVFLYGPTTAYGSSATYSSTIPTGGTGYSASVGLTGLAPNTIYHFCCQVTNGQGTATSPDATFTTAALPSVTTLAATVVTDINATLNGSVSPNGDNVQLYFDLGTTTSYGISPSSTPSIASGTNTVSVSGSAPSLQPNTTYHYRLHGVDNGGGNYTGADMTFTTAAPVTPPSVGSVSTTSVAAKTATVEVSSVSSGGAPATLTFDYGTTTSYGSTATYSSTFPTNFTQYDPNITLSGLNPSTTYHFRAQATSSLGTVNSADGVFTTLPAPLVGTSAASGVKDLVASLNGTANPEGGTLGPSFDYGPTVSYGSTGIASPSYISGSSSTAVTASLAGLTPSSTYHYRLKAQDAGGTYYYGSDFVFTTTAPATPPTLGTVSSTVNAATKTFVNVSSVYAGSSTTTVYFDYGLTNSYGSTVTYPSTIATGTTVYTPNVYLTGLTPGTVYHYRCRATNGQGTVTTGDATFTTFPAPVVTTTPATSVKDLSATINGTANAEGGSLTMAFAFGTTTSYGSFYYPSNETVSGSSTAACSTSISGLLPNTTYHYRLSATDNSGTAYNGADMSFTTTAAATPPTVGTLTATATATSASLQVSSVSAGSSATTVTFSYGPTTAYGSTLTYGNALSINSTVSYLAVTASGLSPNSLYHYSCTATNGQGSASTPDATFTTLPTPVVVTAAATGVADISATINGSANPNGGNLTVHFDYGTTTSYGSTVYPSPDSLTGTSTVAVSASPSVVPNTTYHYRLTGVDGSGTAYYGADMTFTTGPPATPPTVSTGTASSYGATWAQIGAVNLTAGSSTTTLYFDYGLTTNYGSLAVYSSTFAIGSTAASPGLVISGLTPGSTYHFRARAVNAQGTASGADSSFTTPTLPVVTTGSATGVTDIKATLGGTGNANGSSYLAAFDYGTTTAYGASVHASPSTVNGTTSTSVTASPPDLLPNTTYHYRVKLTDLYSNNYYGSDATFSTSAPATPPTVNTAGATAITATTAQLNASGVTSGSSPALLVFHYGLTTAYGSNVPAVTVTTDRAVNNAGALITGLQPQTTYHFQATISNGQGSATGQDMTLTTLGPATATTNPATGVADLTATLNGSVNPAGAASTAIFDYGLTPSYGSTASPTSPSVSTAGNVNESATISGLQPQTTYHYRMRLTNLDGTYTGADGTFTTSSPATAPTIGSSSSGSVGTSSAKLYAGNVNAGSSATTLVFDYGLSTAYGSLISWPLSIPTQSTVGSANVTVTGLLPSTTYHYRVAAINGQGTTYTADNTFTTAGVPTIVTGTVSAQDVTALTSGSANANGGTLTLYYDYGSTTAYGQLAAASPSSVSGSSSTSVTGSLTGLTPSTTLHYRLKALDAAGIYWYGADMTSSTTAPSSAPAVLTGTASPSATSAWLSATNISAGGAPATLSWSYGLTTAYGSSLAYSPVFPLGTTSYGVTGNITGLTPSTTYHFQAVITSALGTNYGGDATFTTPAISVTATTLPATGIRSTTATLNGSYINTASSSTLTFNFGPTISYGTSVAAVPVNISTGSVNAVLTNLTPGATYHYQLVNSPPGGTAYGADMTFAALATNAAVAITGTATGSSNGSATFQGTVNAVSGTAAAVIEYGLTTDYGYVVPAVPDPVTGSLDTAVGATATGLTNYSTYHYRVDATNSQGTTYGSDATVQIYPPPSIEYLPVDVNAQSATLSAFVSGSGYIPDGSYFEYGTTTSYGTILPIYNGISYMLAQAGGIDGWNFPFPNNPYLKPGTTYHYNLVVTGAGGTTYGSDMTFTTDYPAPSVAYPAVSAVTSTSATLNATVTETGGTDTVGFYYGLTSGHGATVNAAPGTASGNGSFPVSATLTDLQPGTTYHYQAWAFHLVNGNEVSFAFADQSFTTLSNVQSWRQQYFGTTAESGAMADSASYANDGVANLLKYALGLDPTVPGANLLPTAILKNYNGVTYLSYTFPRDPTKTDLTYQVVSASNPGGPWTAIATSAGGAATTGPGFVAETPGTGNLINVEVHDTVPTTAATARFLQLVVTDSTE